MDADIKKQRTQQRIQAFFWLRELFPSAFPKAPKPLKIGIHRDILNLALSHAPQEIILRQALAHYVHSPHYLRAMKAGHYRFDLFGEISGEVSESAHQLAKEHMKKHKIPLSINNLPNKRDAQKTHSELPQKQPENKEIIPLQKNILRLNKKLSTSTTSEPVC